MSLARVGLDLELSWWRRAGRLPVLWWRDDDAKEASPALERLFSLSTMHEAPLTLALVPVGGQPQDLARAAVGHPHISFAQHGVAHENRARSGEPPSEIVDTDTVETAAARIATGRDRMLGLPRALPLYVPPWNRTEPPVAAALEAIGFRWLSGFDAYADRVGGLVRVDTHLDVLRWGGGARFRGRDRIWNRIRRLFEARRLAGRWSDPVGLLTHHLDHDDATWDFLSGFLARNGEDFTILSAEDAFTAAEASLA